MSRYKVLYIFCRWIILSDQLGSYVGAKGGDKITWAPEEIQVQLLWEMFHASVPSEYSWTNTYGCEAFHVSNLWEVVHTENTLTRTRNETYELEVTSVTIVLQRHSIWETKNEHLQIGIHMLNWWKIIQNNTIWSC